MTGRDAEQEASLPLEHDKGIAGICCSCGYQGEQETPCLNRDDRTHCEHWWDGPDEPTPPAPAGEEEQEAKWGFVVWSEEGRDGYSVCLHRGPLESADHICIGYQPKKALAEKQVAKGNAWLQHRDDELARLREELEDGNAAYRSVMEEACAGGITYDTDDRLHCTCVPHLREGVKALKAQHAAAQEARDGWKANALSLGEELQHWMRRAREHDQTLAEAQREIERLRAERI